MVEIPFCAVAGASAEISIRFGWVKPQRLVVILNGIVMFISQVVDVAGTDVCIGIAGGQPLHCLIVTESVVNRPKLFQGVAAVDKRIDVPGVPFERLPVLLGRFAIVALLEVDVGPIVVGLRFGVEGHRLVEILKPPITLADTLEGHSTVDVGIGYLRAEFNALGVKSDGFLVFALFLMAKGRLEQSVIIEVLLSSFRLAWMCRLINDLRGMLKKLYFWNCL